MDHRSETGLWFISQAALSRDYHSIFRPICPGLSGQSEPIGVFHGHAFDAKNMLFAAIEKVAIQDADEALHIPRQALRDARCATRNLSELTDNQSCTPQASVPIPISLFAKTTLANIRQNVIIALVTVSGLLLGVLLGKVHMSGGMLIHEASVLVVILNGMRLLRKDRL